MGMKIYKFTKIKSIRFSIPSDDQKYWVEVEFYNGTMWMPSLIDLGDIISKIGKCEDIKYPGGEGYKYTQRFLNKCFNKMRFEINEIYKHYFDPNNLMK